MKVVLDSTVLVAAIAAHGTCAESFLHVLANHEFAVDDNLVAEVDRVLREKLRVPADRVAAFTRLLRAHATLTEPPPLPGPVCRDPDDDRSAQRIERTCS